MAPLIPLEGRNFVKEADQPQAAIDAEFEQAVKRAVKPFRPPVEEEEIDLSDSDKTFRTNLMLLWSLSNVLLVIVVNNTSVTNLSLTVTPSFYFFSAVLQRFSSLFCPFPLVLVNWEPTILLEYF